MGAEERNNPMAQRARILALGGHLPSVGQSREKQWPDGFLDSRGRALAVGDEIILLPGVPTYFRVVAIEETEIQGTPVKKVTVAGQSIFASPEQVVNGEIVLVRRAADAGPSPFAQIQPEEHSAGIGGM